MSAINEQIVREYFESLGFVVAQPSKYTQTGRHKKANEEVDFLIVRPSVKTMRMPDSLTWHGPDFKSVNLGVVGIRGWHTGRFSTSMLEKSPEILKFASDQVVKAVTRPYGEGPVARILCLPQLPASGDLKQKTISLLRDKGIDGIISYPTMLTELIRHVDTHKNYEKSDVLQMIRILKTYELFKDDQLDLFGAFKRK
jgi:hypothetical protein